MKAVSSQWSVLSKSAFCFALCALLFARCIAAEAQQAKKLIRLGYLSTTTAKAGPAAGIRSALRERDYVEGQNLIVESRYGEGENDRYAEIAAELVRLKVDIIVVTGGAPLIHAAKNATKTIPIVVLGPFDPIETGLVDSLARLAATSPV
jgi:ABC-type uncharacterized transport system substrate-binding protein